MKSFLIILSSLIISLGIFSYKKPLNSKEKSTEAKVEIKTGADQTEKLFSLISKGKE
jgi:hypothetical protein